MEEWEDVNEMKYLGNMLSNDVYDPSMNGVKPDFIGKANSCLADFD